MQGDPCSSVYCGSICEGICGAAEDICGAIGVTTSGCSHSFQDTSLDSVLIFFYH